jgi:hypothetical protein
VHGPCANCCCSRIGCITVRLSPESRPDPTRPSIGIPHPSSGHDGSRRRMHQREARARMPTRSAPFRPGGNFLQSKEPFFINNGCSSPSVLRLLSSILRTTHRARSCCLIAELRVALFALVTSLRFHPSFLSNPTLPWSPRKGFHLNPARACLDSERLRCVLLELTGDVADDGQQPE